MCVICRYIPTWSEVRPAPFLLKLEFENTMLTVPEVPEAVSVVVPAFSVLNTGQVHETFARVNEVALTRESMAGSWSSWQMKSTSADCANLRYGSSSSV